MKKVFMAAANWFNRLIGNDTELSSGRFLNVIGGVVIGGYYIADLAMNKIANIELSIIVASYYGGIYTVASTLSYIKGRVSVNKKLIDKEKDKQEGEQS